MKAWNTAAQVLRPTRSQWPSPGLRWPGMNLGFDVVSKSVPPAPKVMYESTAACGKLTIESRWPT